MLLWVVFAVLTAIVVALVARPLLGAASASDADANETEAALNIYRDQLAELEREQSRGLLAEAEASAARAEVARRLIARAETDAEVSARTVGAASVASRRGMSRRIGFASLAVLPLLAILLYARLGSPEVASRPLATRVAVAPAQAGVDELIARVEARLAENPEDGAGWDVIAPIYLRQRRFDDAIGAYTNALRVQGESMARLAGLAEAAISGADGSVPEIARQAYARIVAKDPTRLDARFWLAVAKEQDGKRDEARAEYEAILRAGPEDAPWRATVNERFAAVGGVPAMIIPGLGGAPFTPRTPSAQGPDRDGGPGPGQAEIEAAMRQSPEERATMIRSMVAGLAERLQANSADPAGWQRLVRAYIVLGEKDNAQAALVRARQALAGDAAGLGAVETAARQLGLAP